MRQRGISRALSALVVAGSAALLVACGSSIDSAETSDTPAPATSAPAETQSSDAGSSAPDDGTSSAEPTASAASSEAPAGDPVELTWWHNGTGEPLKGFWAKVGKDFEAAHPNVKVTITAVQNEELQRTKIPNALRSDNPPDLFQQWGGGELAAQVEAGKVTGHQRPGGRRTRPDRRQRRRLAGRRQDLRTAVQPRRRGLLVQQGPVRGGRDHGPADHAAPS